MTEIFALSSLGLRFLRAEGPMQQSQIAEVLRSAQDDSGLGKGTTSAVPQGSRNICGALAPERRACVPLGRLRALAPRL